MIWALWLCATLLTIAFTTDIRTRKIPNYLTVTVIFAGLFGHIAIGQWHGLMFSGLGAMCGFGIMLVLFLIRAVGAGDVKLFAGIGACMGAPFTWETFIYAILYGGLIATGIMLFGRGGNGRHFGIFIRQLLWFRSWIPIKDMTDKQTVFPFMWAVLLAAVTAYWGKLWI